VAILPLGRSEGELQSDRSLTLWPYTDLADPRLRIEHNAVIVQAQGGRPLKIGVGPNPGRLGYLLDGFLFTKEVPPALDRPYADRGAVGQIYVGPDFCELESLGALANLDPGQSVTHRELWSLAECDDAESARQRLVAI
jgi:hypothetical protein